MEDPRGTIINKLSCSRCGKLFLLRELFRRGAIHGKAGHLFCDPCDDLNVLDYHAKPTSAEILARLKDFVVVK